MFPLVFNSALVTDKEMLVGPKGKREQADVSDKEHDGDAQRQAAFHYRTPTGGTGIGGKMKNGGNNERDRSERERNDRGACPGAVKFLFLVLRASEKDRKVEDEED